VTIEAYCGLFGSGKTYAMVMEAYNVRRRHPEIRVLTNLTELNLPGREVEFIGRGESLEEMMGKLAEFHSGYLLLDEVGVFLPARLWAKMPPEVSYKWTQLRKDGVELRWTCVRPGHAVKDLRDITFQTTWCHSWRRFGFFWLHSYSYTSVGDKRYSISQRPLRFRPGVASKLYDTMGKVRSPWIAGGLPAGTEIPGPTLEAA